jgi:hypothetical protein
VTGPNPADVDRMIAAIRAATAESRERVEAWNRQMLDAVEIIRTAAKHDHGVIVSVSHVDNVIEVVEWPSVPAGTAYVFDRDRTSGTATVARLADWIHDDTPLGTVASGYDPVRAYRLPFEHPYRTMPGSAGVVIPPKEA